MLGAAKSSDGQTSKEATESGDGGVKMIDSDFDPSTPGLAHNV